MLNSTSLASLISIKQFMQMMLPWCNVQVQKEHTMFCVFIQIKQQYTEEKKKSRSASQKWQKHCIFSPVFIIKFAGKILIFYSEILIIELLSLNKSEIDMQK